MFTSWFSPLSLSPFFLFTFLMPSESECRSVLSDSLWPASVQSREFSRPEYWSGWPSPSPGDLPNPGIEPRSLALQADSLPVEPQGQPKSTQPKKPISSLADLPDPGNEPGSPALQADSLPTEVSGKEQGKQYSMPGRGLKAGAPGFGVQVSNSTPPSLLSAYIPWNKPLQGSLEIYKLNQITHILKHPQSFLCLLE